ncbi:cysteine-tryptophan domain-containing zinc finger protein 7-like isoform X2 [Impatiens glandulifera]|uniref:cysteine-tryptophan domain-containing zinc finger protein 7-like isoform X2 n=1 Tax=Impatiens glandulifera TaxID=253017 RepID=UPI001FB0A5A9|nr:cysteine-tryptophan domain-containing zinc finger protein 7-like isoform X2 [Impatiens glandulifera]
MISLGSRDDMKRLPLGYGAEEEEEDMGITELEEGEAFSSHENNNDLSIDPDTLSYIDKKLEHVLGHFQKDFEGGVSAENLGAKYGGYGSFLPTYQRSPVWSQSRPPSKVQNSGNHGSVNINHNETSQSNLVNEDIGMRFSSCVVESAPRLGLVNNSAHSSDQKPLRVRIKVGSDTVPPKKNIELYSGLGLDVSPASSLNGSPTKSEGLSCQPKDGPDVSPSTIVQMMTAFPLLDGLVLSPLPNHLICLTEKEKFRREKSMHRSVQKGVKENSKGCHSIMGDVKGLGGFKVKSSNSDTFSVESKYHLGKDVENYSQGPLMKEELVGNTLKLPLLSRSVDYGKGTAKLDGISRVGNNIKEECLLADLVKEEADAHGNALIKPRKGRNVKEEKLVSSTKSSTHSQNGRKTQTDEVMGSSNWKAGQEALSHEEYNTELTTAKQTSSVGNKKPKSKHVVQGAKVPKDNSNANGNFSKTKIGESRLLDQQKGNDIYTDFFGDRQLGDEYNDVESVGTPSPLVPMNNELSGKNTLNDCTSKGRMMMNVEKMEKAPRFDAPSKGVSDLPPPSGNGLVGDADNWVGCDKCQKWRLLPPGTNPESLPEKWLCSMLDWLPGLNRCSVSEEDSTKALIARYQPHPSNGQTIQAGQSTVSMSGPNLSSAGRADQSRENRELPSVPCVGKKKPAMKEISNSMNLSNSEQLLNSSKKNIQASTQSGSLNEVVQIFPAADDLSHSTKHDTIEKYKNNYKEKEKNKQIEYSSEGGEMRSSKTKNKRGPDRYDQEEDFSRGAKRTKRENVHHMDENRLRDHGGPVEKVRPCTSSELSADASGKEKHRSKEHLKVNKNDGNGKAHIISNDGDLDMQKYDAKDVRKRQHKQVSIDSFVNGHLNHDIMGIIEETNENNHKIGKKAKVSKSEGKEDPGCSVSRQRVDAIEPLVKDIGSLQPSIAAASSSSKVSGSNKNKDILQEMRGSPVESVSSSPLRILNHDRAKLTRRNPELKEDSGEAGLFPSGTFRRSSDRQDKGRREHLLDTPGKNMEYSGASKARVYVAPSQLENFHNADGCNGSLRQNTQYPTKLQTTDQWNDEGKINDSDGLRDASHGRKSRKGSLSGSKEKGGDRKSEPDKGKDKLSNYSKESFDNASPCEDIGRSGKCRVLEKSRISSDKIAKDLEDKVTIEKAKREPQLKLNVKEDVFSSQDQKQNQRLDGDGEKSSRKSISTTDQIESSRREKSKSLPPSGRSQNEGLKLANGSSIGASEGGYAAVKRAKHVKSLENQNADQPTKSRNLASNGNRIQDVNAPSPLRKDSSSQAANSATKEATNLKHMADRVKNSGESGESTSLYFQAALKFLRGASLFELSSSETSNQSELNQSMQMYSSTAKLCEFCAHEYEKSKDMAAAALAYKCMEVAYMRVVYMSHSSASRARQELQTTLHIVPGESPSSSVSDVDNLNNPATADKVPLTKGVSSPQVVGHHVVTARNRPSFQRLLNFAQEVNYGMEASRKSRAAFAAAKPRNEEVHQKESLSSVKRALDFSFHDVEGFLCLVRLAMDAMSR